MDLTAWLLGRTPVRPLIASAVGATGVRLAVEREMRLRGWRPALNPAEANLLVVAGPDDAAMAPFVDAVWQLVPAPRVRIGLADPSEVPAALSEAERRLRSRDEQRSSTAAEMTDVHVTDEVEHHADASHGQHEHHHEPAPNGEHDQHAPDEHMDHGEHHEHTSGAEHDQHGGGGHSEHMDHGHHHGHDMGGMEMPGGIPMADRADDRDGLKLDRLTVPLGPVLPAWPSGLLVRVVLQGDVVQEAVVATVLPHGHGTPPFWDGEARIAARRLDSCVRLLTVADWEYAAVTAARLRDDLLAGEDVDVRFARWARQVRRSRILRWSLTGIGAHAASGDAWDRLTRWIDEAAAALKGTENPGETDPTEILDALPTLLTGTELATARLVVASFDPDLERLRVSHG
ncbi:hypothetical protein [Amycolatopsis sp. SID8362]|uniref:hypothetical protein n=1 Tax=Amycolatopsis sp. SID8362 TaxID=2690346 RepID=UPI001371E683|nr:hypothetical protein [Amycolatopsis sp. SID8362]NBH03436.1 hypothetical protein [Amycolatopsis sp. SID8362]NED40136.1 hypothetical protein [Amycolatopsis sp. SID8362]